MKSSENKKRVLVAMSGGVDSSVAAALLVEQGYDVVGITMQVWDYTQSECTLEEGNGTCCSSIDVDDARSVADILNIPFYVMNCEAKFKTHVIDDFVNSYKEGRTPIPCVNCNTFLKFDHLFDKMKELGCDYIATGHYAQIQESPKSGNLSIVTSEDDWKDQTYFLFTLKPELLKHIMFPVGDWTKPQLRDYAEKKGLIVARKKDSVGICFIGKSGYAGFVEERIEDDEIIKGDLKLHPSGQVLGQHNGIHHFTYGQRKGLGVSYNEALYVITIDAKTGDVWLGPEEFLYSQKMKVTNINWLDDVSKDESLRVKIRYAHAGSEARLSTVGDEHIELEFLEPQRAITPGQAAVFYRGQQLLGGGWIE